ncbi:MAG TPA: hypothetical protein VHT04_01105 [Stellaceae bacterium]|nr:hypothetical protein [Stellaceae bacterium]
MADPAILIADSVTRLGPEHVGSVLIAGSHGGVYAACLAARAGLRAVILNDAGVGLEQAGIAGLAYLDAYGMAAATVGHDTARIGDGTDMAQRGIVSYVNAAAARLGCAPGQTCLAAAERLTAAAVPVSLPPAMAETRHLLLEAAGGVKIWALDSASLVRKEDAGQIVLLGSHGGGKPQNALKEDCRAAIFNDAGIGIDGAGIARLPVLDGRGIAAAAVSAASARIGDGRSIWESGIVSAVNARAAATGGRVGMTAQALVQHLLRQGEG